MAVCGLLLSGCERAAIEHYRVERLEQPKPRAAAHSSAEGPEQRMLAAIIPHGEQTWFLKLMGPVAAVSEQKDSFDAFIRSIRFDRDGKIEWTAPAGWTHEPGAEMRYATFRLGPPDQPLELAVTPLPRAGESASVLANVNRWRGQLGLGPISAAKLGEVTTELKLDDGTVTLVDMSGVAAASGGMTAPFASSRRPGGPPPSDDATRRSPIRYQTPDGWKELPGAGAGGMRVAAFQAGDAENQAEVTVIRLGGAAGGLAANVNRWRGQIGLAGASEEQIRKDAAAIDIAGAAADYFDLTGPESAGARRERILGVVAPRGDQTWFLKMKGPADLVASQKPAFESFARSLKFE